MKRLFSPWRSAYIETFNSDKKTKGCLFCKISGDDRDDENLVVWRGKYCYLVMNRFPYNSGHLLAVPYKHTSDFSKLSEGECAEIMWILGKSIKALELISKPHGFNLGANLGRVAGAGIDKHIHFHLVPRWNGDTNFMPVLAETKLVSEEIRKTYKEIRRKLRQARLQR